MIVRPRPSVFGLLVILRGSILPAIASELLAVLCLALAVAWAHHLAPLWFATLTAAPFTLLGLALSIFLGFRNNACYQRWSEARGQWGLLLAESRGFMRDAGALLPAEEALTRRLTFRLIGFAHALRAQLRGAAPTSVKDWIAPETWIQFGSEGATPDAILRAEAADLAAALRQGLISDVLYRLFADRLLAITNIQAACERLKSTPTPFAYTLLLHRTAWLFCLLLPFGLVSSLGFFTPVVTAILAYAFFGLDALGQELEEPFSLSPNAVPLDALVRNIEIAGLQAIGVKEVSPPLEAKAYVLL